MNSIIQNDKITLEAELFSLDGSQRFYEKKSSQIENAKELGREIGQILKTKSNNSYKKYIMGIKLQYLLKRTNSLLMCLITKKLIMHKYELD